MSEFQFVATRLFMHLLHNLYDGHEFQHSERDITLSTIDFSSVIIQLWITRKAVNSALDIQCGHIPHCQELVHVQEWLTYGQI